jgi:uncharacterized protein (DUF433 family)
MIDPTYQQRIVRDPKCCGGQPVIRGTRVTLRAILASLAEGDRPEEIVQAFPSICIEDVYAAMASAESAGKALPQQTVLSSAS